MAVLHLGFCQRGGAKWPFTYFMGGAPNGTFKVYYNVGGSGSAPPRKIFDFEITSGEFLDPKFSS